MQKSFIIIKGRPQALRIEYIQRESSQVYAVKFLNTDSVYRYAAYNITILTDTKHYNPTDCKVYVDGIYQSNIAEITAFPQGNHVNWRITYKSGFVRDFLHSDRIEVEESCLANDKARNVFDYLKEIAAVNTLGKDDDTLGILTSQYDNISFIDKTLAIAPYICPEEVQVGKLSPEELIFPFGCNASQKNAVCEAFSNQLSVIQGPPGTGKTQTILNIIANIVMQGKTVLVVSNNNSATANIKEKLEKYGLDFITAFLGNRDNKEIFLQNQPHIPTHIQQWETDFRDDAWNKIRQTLLQLNKVFDLQEQLANLKLEVQTLKVEWEHFKVNNGITENPLFESSMKASAVMSLWIECQAIADSEPQELRRGIAGFIDKIKWWWKSRKIKRLLHFDKVDKDNLWPVITELQKMYLQTRLHEIKDETENTELSLNALDAQGLSKQLTDESMRVFKDSLYLKYKDVKPFVIQEAKDIRTHADKFCKRYPVILSTTFSARTSIPYHIYDYVIMDEASQVSIETGALALTCANNAVIVGDTMQLPNVVTNQDKVQLNEIHKSHKVPEGYNSADNSFLESLCKVIPDVKQTLLREHYRCNPRIINFCNQKFYGGNLLIMTEDSDEKNVVSAIKTVPGRHARNRYNQREIDVIGQEVLPTLPSKSDVGIVSPYNAQVDAINRQLGDIAATVHKYQGREKGTIIFSVVDDEITEFSDDPNLLNVAISRAKEKFCLVVTGNKQEKSGNITDLIDYIEYNNCSVTESKIFSIFDYMYGAYTQQRLQLLSESKQISEYDSENLTYALICKILKEHNKFSNLGVLCHYPLRMLIRDTSAMTDEERLYASRQGTHLDFLIFSHVTKKPLLAIETDGYSYHNENTTQHKRDLLKDSILKKYGVTLLRLSTIESGEEERIIDALTKYQ